MSNIFNESDYVRSLLDEEDIPSKEYADRLLADDLCWDARVSCLSWILQAGKAHELGHETKYLAISFYHRYLWTVPELDDEEREFYLLGLCCFLLATKMQESKQLDITEGPEGSLFMEDEIKEKEKDVMTVLEYNFDSITPFKFLGYFMQQMSKPTYLDRAVDILMISLRHIGVLRFRPSLVAAAAALISSSDEELTSLEIDTMCSGGATLLIVGAIAPT